MGFWRGVKKTTGFVFNFKVSQWLDYETIKGGAAYFIFLAKSIYTPKPGTGFDETYEMAKERLHLTDAEIELQAKNYLLTAYIYLVASLALLSYTAYLVYHHHRLSSFLTGSITLYSLTFCIRNHFWYYQLQQKKLGCSFSEWFISLFRPKSKLLKTTQSGLQCMETNDSNDIVKNDLDEKSTFKNEFNDSVSHGQSTYESLYENDKSDREGTK